MTTTMTKHHAPRRKKRLAHKSKVTEDAASSNSPPEHAAAFIEPDQRLAMISDAAYFRAEAREFCPGHEMEDWLAAEREIDQILGRDGTGCGSA